uniref:Uncharacterized protein n=1 Tax=Panagrolaimus superbus TaxID=310955 RepID=A0A914YXR7_9BILA
MDLPPAPELPPMLDIDHYGYPGDSGGDNISENGMTSSSTIDTIVEVIKNAEGEEIDPTLGETQKYIMQVPAPGLTEQEMEMHKSLMKHNEDAGDDSDTELKLINDIVSVGRKISSPLPPPTSSNTKMHSKDSQSQQSHHHDPLRREYSNAAKQRPRPTTPTQKCTLESYVSEQEKSAPPISTPVEKIKINIPRKSLKGRQPEDFYQSMSNQMPPQSRQHRSNSNFSNGGGDWDDDVDIIEQNPEYKDKAPKTPVVHRRISVEWEAFDQSIGKCLK